MFLTWASIARSYASNASPWSASSSWARVKTRPGWRAAEHGAHPGAQLARAERLGHVIIRAELEPDQLVRLVRARGEHHDRPARLAPQVARHVQPVAAWP